MDMHGTKATSTPTEVLTRAVGLDRRRSDRTAEGNDVAQLEGLLSRLQVSTRGTLEDLGL